MPCTLHPNRLRNAEQGRIRCLECGRLAATEKRKKKPLYDTWYMMIRRCYSPAFKDWHLYGGKAIPIKVCLRWRDSYELFVLDMGDRPLGHTLERKDCNGPYCPENCIWATPMQQSRNTSRTKWIEIDGEKRSPMDWARISGRGYSTIIERLARGLGDKESVFGPLFIRPKK